LPLFRPCEPPSAHNLPWRRLYNVSTRGVDSIIVLSDQPTFFPLHFDVEAKRFIPCYRDPALCLGCEREWPSQVYAYLSVLSHPGRGLYLLAIPPAAWQNCAGAEKLLTNARGLVLWLSRTVPSPRGPISVEVKGRYNGEEKLPAGWNVTSDVYRRFGFGLANDPQARELAEAGQFAGVEGGR